MSKWYKLHNGMKAMLMMVTLFSSPSHAIELSGLYKNLLLTSETIIGPPEDYVLDINRIRLGLSQNWQNIQFELIYDNEFQFGSYLDSLQFRQFVEMDDVRYWKLQGNSLDKDNVYATHQLYRGTVQVTHNDFDLRLGRQQINWASTLIWNPLDRFNPLNPLQLEREERQGVDALLLDYNIHDLSRLSLVYSRQENPSDQSAAVRFKSNQYDIDYSLIAGRFLTEDKLGFGLASQIGLIGLRAEIVWSDPKGNANGNEPYIETVVSADYTNQAGIKFVLEGYFNGDGETDITKYQFSQILTGQKLGLAKRYLGGMISKELTPLLELELLVIANLDDHSQFFSPTLNYDLPTFEDVYLKLGAQLFTGTAGTEYAFYENLYFGELTYYF